MKKKVSLLVLLTMMLSLLAFGSMAHAEDKEYEIAVVVLTRGGDGARIYFDDQACNIASMKVKVVDTTGAGDAYWGGFLSSLLRQGVRSVSDLTLEKLAAAGRYGAASGGLCVQKLGGIPALPTKQEIEAVLE